MSWLRLTMCLSILFFVSHFSFSQPKDTLYFYNKTKIVGELLTIKLGRIEFDADGVTIIKVKNTKVSSINATSRSFRMESLEGREVQGSLARSEKPGMVILTPTKKARKYPWRISPTSCIMERQLRADLQGICQPVIPTQSQAKLDV